MSENELRSELRSMRDSLVRIETQTDALSEQLHEINVNLVGRVVRLETQMKIALAIAGAGGLGAAGIFGFGG